MATPGAATLTRGRPRLPRPVLDTSTAVAAAAAGLVVLLVLRGSLLGAFVGFLGLALVLVALDRRPVLTVGGTVVLTAFENPLLAYGGGLVPVRQLVTGVIAALAIHTAWSYVSGRRRYAVGTWPGVVLLATWLLVVVLSVPYAPDVQAAVDGLRYQCQWFVLFLALAYAQWPDDRRDALLKVIVAVVGGAVLYAAMKKATGASDGDLANASTYDVVGDEVALFGSFLGRQELAGWMGVMVPLPILCTFLLTGRKRYLGIPVTALGVLVVLWSNTRIGLVALGAGMVVAGLLVLGSRAATGRREVIAVALVLGMLGGVTAYSLTVGGSQEGRQRYAAIAAPSTDGSGDAHLRKWEQTLRDMRGKPLGHGMGQAGKAHDDHGRFINADTFEIDSSYLVIAYQLGFGMMAALFAAVLAIFYSLAKGAMAATRRVDGLLAIAACAAIAGWLALLTTGIFLERWCTFMVFLLAGLAAMPFVQRREPQGG